MPELDLFQGLKALSDASFPKTCPNCGRVYKTPGQFVLQSDNPPNHSGLKASEDTGGEEILEVFRNCGCGSTLMDFFEDRRDRSPAGQRRRRLFDDLVLELQDHGLTHERAHHELRMLMRGEPCPAIEALGIEIHIN